jgi:hypothetical protein
VQLFFQTEPLFIEILENMKQIVTNNFSRSDGRRSKKPKTKQKFPCPKCDKVWNWPWELRRHLVMHFKEVTSDRSTKNSTNLFLL